MTTPAMRRGEIIAGSALACLGLYIANEARQWVLLGPNGPGPGFFPLGYGSLMVVFSLILVVRAARAPVSGIALETTDWRGVSAALLVWLAFLAMVPLMRFFGFALAFALLAGFVTRVVYSRSPRFCLLAATLLPLGFYGVFTLLLQVNLPRGSLTGF